MKPNPVKKMVEYCARKGECCNAYEKNNDNTFCMKHNKYTKVLGDLTNVERPSWCSDETFVRVRIIPVMDGEVEYCTSFGEKCNRVFTEDGEYRCCITFRYWIGDLKRPEACRKLEVE